MIDTDKYEGHTPKPWSVSRGQRNTILIESETLGCSDCGSADIYTYENTNGDEIQFPHSVEPEPFSLSPDKYRGRWEMYCPSCDLLDYAVSIDATQNNADLELIADAPLLLAEVKRLSAEVRRLRDMVCLLEDSRITNMSILDRPELFADVAEVFRQRKEDTHGHLPNFGEEE
jgi:hypothetical protein